MKPLHNLIIATALLVPACMNAQVKDRYQDEFIGWIKTLGSDEFGGRKPMTEYETKTIDYLAGEFSALGLQPAFEGSYFQTVKEIAATVRLDKDVIPVKAAKGRTSLKYPDDLVVWTSRAQERIDLKNVGYVFCGFGIDAPEYGWNDFEGADVKGKIVLAMVNDPGYYDNALFCGRNMTYYGRWVYKFEEAKRKGAAGCLVVHNAAAASYDWQVCVNGHVDSNLALFDDSTGNADELALKGWFQEDACRRLLAQSGLNPDEVMEAAKRPGFKAIELKAKSDIGINVDYTVGETCNVGAVLPGTDLKDECVVFSAHWDHFGYSTPDATGDEIYNGAADNGSGLAAMLLIAKKFSEIPAPRRSIMFLSTTSEESGLMGAEHYCEHPAFPMEKTAVCINFDCVAPSPLTRDFVILGGGQSGFDRHIVAAAAAQDRYVVYDDDNSDGWFYRSDHYQFVKKGVPAVVLMEGKDLVDPSKQNRYPRADWYHKPSDEYREDWDVSGALANINLMFAAGLSVANLGL
ncbi:MAG: M28 family peptidase [Bacteroidia bacterium]|nr:M28 family peptidase [Bacteroidia bacterium]